MTTNSILLLAYLIITGMITGLTISSEYARCGIPVSDERLEKIAFSSVLWPVIISSALFIRPEMLAESKCPMEAPADV